MSISLEVGKKKPGEKVDIMEFMYGSVPYIVKHMLQNLILSQVCIKGLSYFASIFAGKMFLNYKFTKQILKQLPFIVTGDKVKFAHLSELCDCQNR